jgi:uncharacterized protein YbjT (DUF2867 family)
MQHAKIAVAGATGQVGRHVVDLLSAAGHQVVPISRSAGVDVITGNGLAEALTGADAIIDVLAGPSSEQRPATEFFTTAARNLHQAGERAGVARYVVVSIIGVEKSTGGYGSAKLAHEQAVLAGPVPARILRVTQFHELVGLLMDMARQGDVIHLPEMRTQIIAARTVAEALAAMATSPEAEFAAARAGEAAGAAGRGPARRPGPDRGGEGGRPGQPGCCRWVAAPGPARQAGRADVRGLADHPARQR